MPRKDARLYTDDDLIGFLRAAAEISPSPMSAANYTDNRVPGSPAMRTHIIRFGSWSDALARAGLPTTNRKKRKDNVTVEQCLQAVMDYVRMTGDTTAEGYGRWSPNHDAPSGSIVREKCGSWTRAHEMIMEMGVRE